MLDGEVLLLVEDADVVAPPVALPPEPPSLGVPPSRPMRSWQPAARERSATGAMSPLPARDDITPSPGARRLRDRGRRRGWPAGALRGAVATRTMPPATARLPAMTLAVAAVAAERPWLRRERPVASQVSAASQWPAWFDWLFLSSAVDVK